MGTKIPTSVRSLIDSNIQSFWAAFYAADAAKTIASAGIITTVTDHSGGEYGQMGDFFDPPKMRVTSGGTTVVTDVPFKDLRKRYEEFKNPVGWTRADAENDMFGKYDRLFSKMGAEASRYMIERATLIVTENQDCWTGSPLLGTHTINSDGVEDSGSITVDNTVSSTVVSTSTITVSEMISSIDLMDSTMSQFKDWQGRPMGHRPDTLMVPPALAGVAFRALTGASIDGAGGQQFPDSGFAAVIPVLGGRKLFINPYLTSTVKAYGLSTRDGDSPLRFVERTPATIETTGTDTTEYVLDSRIVQTGRLRGIEFAGSPQTIVEVTYST